MPSLQHPSEKKNVPSKAHIKWFGIFRQRHSVSKSGTPFWIVVTESTRTAPEGNLNHHIFSHKCPSGPFHAVRVFRRTSARKILVNIPPSTPDHNSAGKVGVFAGTHFEMVLNGTGGSLAMSTWRQIQMVIARTHDTLARCILMEAWVQMPRVSVRYLSSLSFMRAVRNESARGPGQCQTARTARPHTHIC